MSKRMPAKARGVWSKSELKLAKTSHAAVPYADAGQCCECGICG